MVIQKYTSKWPQQFENLKQLLHNALVGHYIRIEHIGSTSVPGLASKPIIDIDIVYDLPTDFNILKKQLTSIGYYHNGDQGIPKREVFKRQKPSLKHPILDNIKHHLYACPIDSEELQRHLLFRDRLRTDKSARVAYQQLKFELAEEAAQDAKTYALLKEERARAFILSCIQGRK